jgi:DNA-binding XRE family transcriptional regulator
VNTLIRLRNYYTQRVIYLRCHSGGVATSRATNPKSDPSVAFGELLRKRRTEQKMSQDALAAKSGYERAFISLIERGKTNPSLRSIFDICTALDIKPSVFIRRVEKAANFELPA